MSQESKLEDALGKMDDIRNAAEEWKIYQERVTDAFSEMSDVELGGLDIPGDLKKQIEVFLKKQEPDQAPPENVHSEAEDLFERLEAILEEVRAENEDEE